MKLRINKFTDFSIDRMVLFEMFKIRIENKYFKYDSVIEISSDELEKIVNNMEKLIKCKLSNSETLHFENQQMTISFFPTSTNDRVEMDWEFFIEAENGDIVSKYTLKFEKKDIIALYMYLCETLERENQFDIPDYYEYMFVYVRCLDDEYNNIYCYLSDLTNIRVGNYVLIEVENEEKQAIVEQIEYYSKEDAPEEISKIKRIIRKLEDDDVDIEEIDRYESIDEFKELKKDVVSMRDILANQLKKLSIKELMKTMLREDVYSDAYYNKKMNLIIHEVNGVYYLPKYGRKIFKNKQFKDIISKSVAIYAYSGNDIMDVYDKAINICKENDWKYDDDFEYEATFIEEDYCKINKITDNKGIDVTNDNLNKHICSEVFKKLQIFVRDSDMLEKTLNIYKENIGESIKSKEIVDCTNKIAGMAKNTRTFIVGNSLKDMSVFELDTNWGRNIAEKDSCFKILGVGGFEEKNYVILLHVNKNYAKLMKTLNTNVDKVIKEECISIFMRYLNAEPKKELDRKWYERLLLPIGINGSGNIEKYE